MWLSHWGLARDPFDPADPGWVPTPPHERAVAELAGRILDGAAGRIHLLGPGGIGKSRVLGEMARRCRRPGLRIPLAIGPLSYPDLCARWAIQLSGAWAPADDSAPGRLADAIRLCRLQGESVVLAWDSGAHDPALDVPVPARTPLVIASRAEGGVRGGIAIPPLTRSEAGEYLGARLARAGRDAPAFDPEALTRLHARARGIPSRLDRLAREALKAAAAAGRGLAIAEDLGGEGGAAGRAGMVGLAGSW